MSRKGILPLAFVAALSNVFGISVQETKAGFGSVSGKVRLGIPELSLARAGPLVVYLDAVEGKLAYEVPKKIPSISQRNGQFVPDFLVVAAGQTVEFPNEDPILHNVFSYSKPNAFDLGIFPKGEARSVTFRDPNTVRVYCSIHQSMNAVIFVAPSPYWGLVEASGKFRISNVPPGRYLLRTWNQALPSASVDVEIVKEKPSEVDLLIAEEKK